MVQYYKQIIKVLLLQGLFIVILAHTDPNRSKAESRLRNLVIDIGCGTKNPCAQTNFELIPPTCCCGPKVLPSPYVPVAGDGLTLCSPNLWPITPTPFSFQTADCQCCKKSPCLSTSGALIIPSNKFCCCNTQVDCPGVGGTNWDYEKCECPTPPPNPCPNLCPAVWRNRIHVCRA